MKTFFILNKHFFILNDNFYKTLRDHICKGIRLPCNKSILKHGIFPNFQYCNEGPSLLSSLMLLYFWYMAEIIWEYGSHASQQLGYWSQFAKTLCSNTFELFDNRTEQKSSPSVSRLRKPFPGLFWTFCFWAKTRTFPQTAEHVPALSYSMFTLLLDMQKFLNCDL